MILLRSAFAALLLVTLAGCAMFPIPPAAVLSAECEASVSSECQALAQAALRAIGNREGEVTRIEIAPGYLCPAGIWECRPRPPLGKGETLVAGAKLTLGAVVVSVNIRRTSSGDLAGAVLEP